MVTGGGRGIGRAIALELAREGADVAVSSRTVPELEAVAGEVKSIGRRGIAVRADAMSADETRGAVREAIDQLGRLDVLVNNAGGVLAPRGLTTISSSSTTSFSTWSPRTGRPGRRSPP
jgi:NAD(P)-dependent dehydrogenase (short-subunit alcohol dehydrogenase family)